MLFFFATEIVGRLEKIRYNLVDQLATTYIIYMRAGGRTITAKGTCEEQEFKITMVTTSRRVQRFNHTVRDRQEARRALPKGQG